MYLDKEQVNMVQLYTGPKINLETLYKRLRISIIR